MVMPVSIKDVAKLAGVSISTASNALNNTPLVSEKTREKVLEAARKLNYKPNALARSLVTRRSRTVGLLIPDVSDPYFTEVARGVEDCASEHDYSVVLCNTDRNPDKERRYFNILREKRVDGIIFTGGSMGNERHLLQLEEENAPVVVIGRHSLPFRAVLVDNAGGASLAAEHLISRGHSRIGFIAGPLSSTTSQDRLEGYRITLARHGIPYTEKFVREGDFKIEGGAKAARELLDLPEEERPTAIIAGNDQMAIGVIGVAREKGLQVPRDLAVIGFDDIPVASLITPPLTTVRLPMYEMGHKAMGLLLGVIGKEQESGQDTGRITFSCELVVRGSA